MYYVVLVVYNMFCVYKTVYIEDNTVLKMVGHHFPEEGSVWQDATWCRQTTCQLGMRPGSNGFAIRVTGIISLVIYTISFTLNFHIFIHIARPFMNSVL